MFHGLYRLAKFTSELPDSETALKKISEELKRNPVIVRHIGGTAEIYMAVTPVYNFKAAE